MARYLPILPIDLDPRNEFTLANEAKLRVIQASNNQITDISSGSVVSALMEGFAFSQAELLYYLNQMPEAYTATFLSQILGIQILSSEPATVVIEFIRDSAIVGQSSYLLSNGFRLQSNSGVIFETLSPVNFNRNESIKYVLARAISGGSETNVAANTVTTALQNSSQFSSINNPSPAYGGKDGESYNEAKARAFSQIKRRNPVSADDFAELVEDILGVGTKVKVSEKSSAPLVQINGGRFIAPESDANILIESILAKKASLGLNPDISTEDIKLITSSLSSSNKALEHVFISVRSADNSSIDPLILNRVRLLLQNRAPLGLTIHLQNALVQYVSVTVALQDNSNNIDSTFDIENAIEAYFNELTFGSNLDFSVLSSVISNVANTIDVSAMTSTIVENENLSSESIIDNVSAILNKNGVTIFNRGLAGETTNDGYYLQSDSYPAYADSVLWKLKEVIVINAKDSYNLTPYGTLLECKGNFISVRADGNGGVYLSANDKACGYQVDDD